MPFGSDTPFSEPAWYGDDIKSPYYKDTHIQFRKKVRDFVDEHIRPHVDKWEEDVVSTGKEMPLEVFKKAYEAGIYSPQFPAELGGTPPAGGFDAFHDFILNDELARCGSGGVGSGFSIFTMALPPVLYYGSDYLKEKVCKPVLKADKFISLCISEPYAGSDVANIRTTAKKEGDHYILDGEKKWITWGVFADFFTVACRTGDEGMGGISLLLVERNMPGVSVRRMKCQGNWTGGTSFVTFDNVRVPAKNLIGEENCGFQYIMHNFNHERFVIAVQTCRAARMCIQEAIEYARRRKTFGKKLSSHQVIRHKIAEMAMRVEATHAFIESVCYQMNNNVSPMILGQYMALAKVQASRTYELCAREASQILGGSSYVREGKGQLVERMYREVRATAIPGGSEEIMLDLAVRMARL